MSDGINSRMTAISRTIRSMNNQYTKNGRTCSFSIVQVLDEQCTIVQCSFEKTANLLVEMYPEFWFAFNASAVVKSPIYSVIHDRRELDIVLEMRKNGKKPSKARK